MEPAEVEKSIRRANACTRGPASVKHQWARELAALDVLNNQWASRKPNRTASSIKIVREDTPVDCQFSRTEGQITGRYAVKFVTEAKPFDMTNCEKWARAHNCLPLLASITNGKLVLYRKSQQTIDVLLDGIQHMWSDFVTSLSGINEPNGSNLLELSNIHDQFEESSDGEPEYM